MRGYFSFLLALLGSIILLDILSVYSASSAFDLSRAVSAERAYGLGMNVKETMLESARNGALAAFAEYDRTHDVRMCIHCPDHSCALPSPANPAPPNRCDGALCAACFRESGAREATIGGAGRALLLIGTHEFDPDFSVSLGLCVLEASLGPEPVSRNGFILDSVRFRNACPFNASSEKLGVRSESYIPGGFAVDIG